ncbi:MAG: hypothetical protein Q9210_007153, partial [Variospora velana]
MLVKQEPGNDHGVGGPGMGCKDPQHYGWTEKPLDEGYQILLLEQRGTGMSNTVTMRLLSPPTPEEQGDYWRHFRADSIGAIDAVHDLILRMANDLDRFAYFTRPTLAEYESLQSFDGVSLYALIHELIYLQG